MKRARRLRLLGWIELMTILAAIAMAVVPFPSQWIETWYSTRTYPAMQRALTPLSNRLPFAILDPLLVVVTLAAVATLIHMVREGWRKRRLHVIAWRLGHLAASAALLYLLFLILWGFNYRLL